MEVTNYFIPTHFLIPCIISLSLLILTIALRKTFFNRRKRLWISLIVFLCVYFFIVAYSAYLSNYYQWELQKFDLNGNGSFSINESTPEQQKAMHKVTSDLARNFSFITGLIFAFIVAILSYLAGIIIHYLRKNILPKHK